MYELTRLSATEIARLVRAREVSPVEIVRSYLRRIEELNPSLNAIVALAPDVLERAREAEAALMRGDVTGTLHGVPMTVKDTFDVAGLPSTSGSVLRSRRVPARDAKAVERLRAAGAIILGKTNVPEMAFTYDSENSVYGRTTNPHDASRTPGGSSGGEAAAISASLSAAGLASDLVGSIRIPAHFCGIVGLKPTAGTVPGEGHCPEMLGRLKEAAAFGPMARRVEDLALIFDVIRDARATHEATTPDLFSSTQAVLARGTRVAWYVYDGHTHVTEETISAVKAAARALSDRGLEVMEERPPGIERGAALWLERFSPDVLDAMRRVYRTEQDETVAGTALRALFNRAAHARKLGEDERVRVDRECERLRTGLIEWMASVPLMVSPVGAVPAFEHGARRVRVGDEELNVFEAFGYAQSFNTFNLPVVCVPAGRTREGLPVGVQIAGPPHAEKLVLAAAKVVEEALGGWQPPPAALSTEGQNPL